MSDSAAVYRPSPRPRPVGAPTRPTTGGPRLHVVPVPTNPELPGSDLAGGAASETITAGQSGSTVEIPTTTSDLDFRVRATAAWEATRAYWTAPAVFTDRPASLADLAVYARTAPWTQQNSGPIRAAGLWWYRAVGYPQTVRYRYSEWVWQRPGRTLAVAVSIKLAAHTTPGGWVVDHVIYPAARLAGHVFL